MELTFLCFGIKMSFTELFEHFFDMLVMYRHVIGVYEYIIQIDHDIDI